MTKAWSHLHTAVCRYSIELVLIAVLPSLCIEAAVEPVACLYSTVITYEPVLLLIVEALQFLGETHTSRLFLREIIIKPLDSKLTKEVNSRRYG